MSTTNAKLWGIEKISTKPLFFNALRLTYALSAFNNTSGKILEVGAGAGAFSKAIKQYRHNLDLTATDIDPDLIKRVGHRDAEIHYFVADAQDLPFKKGSFDGVVGFDVFEHLPHPQKGFAEAYRVLKKGGILHCSIPLEASIFTWHGLFLKIGFFPKKQYADHIQQFTKGEIVAMLQRTGFRQISVVYSGHLFSQLADFVYFSSLFFLKRKTRYTVEGYLESMPSTKTKKIISFLKACLASIFYYESALLKNVPGQIGHFTAIK